MVIRYEYRSIVFEINYFIQNKYQQAEIRAKLAKAKSIKDALIILKGSGPRGRMGMYNILKLINLD
jgi:hypothetical protein